MLAKSTRPHAQLLVTRPLYETTSNSTTSDKSNTSRGSQLGLNNNNKPTFGSNITSTQPFAFQYRLSHAQAQATQNVRKNFATGNGAGFGNYQYGNMNGARTIQRQNYTANTTGAVVHVENAVVEKQKTVQVNTRNPTGQLPYRVQESNVNYNCKELKVQETKKEVVTISDTEVVCEKTVTEETNKTTIMNQVGEALINNLDSLRTELSRDLEKCKNTEEIQKAFLSKMDMFDETLKKVLKSYQQLGGQLTRFEGVIEEQFEVILNQFEKTSEEMEDANETIIQKMNTNQTAYYQKAENIKKGITSVKKMMKNIIRNRGAKQSRRKVLNLKNNNTNQQRSHVAQIQANNRRKNQGEQVVLSKRNPEPEKPRVLKRANPSGTQVNLGVELPSKQVKTQAMLKSCLKNKVDKGEHNEEKEVNVEKPKLGMALRSRETREGL